MRRIANLMSAALLAAAAWSHSAPTNVVLIISDDQGYPDLSCIGTKPVKTPNLDRLAAEGVRGTSFYVTWCACTPSRSSVLTGRYPQRNGLYDMVRNDLVNYDHRYTNEEYALSPEMTLGLDVREITIGDVLQDAGYSCGVVGKWDMGQAKRFLPLQRGFDFFYGHGNNGIDYYTHERYGIHSIFRGNERSDEDKGTYITDVFEREALRFLDESKGKPFFLYLAFNAPHGASTLASEPGGKRPGVQAPEEYWKPYLEAVNGNERLARYYGAVTCMDEAIGEVMKRLESMGVEDDTLVMFMSDNGGSGNGDNKPLQGRKGTMWEGGLRVPFIAKWPGRLPAGEVTDEFLTALELFPTIVKATGAKAPEGVPLDGFDMAPILRGEKASPRQTMFWKRRNDMAARVGKWKWLDSAKGKGLYDLSEDIGEKNDLSDRMPEKAAELRSAFNQWLADMDHAEPRGPFRDY